jgi:hypothetical protein
VGGRPLFEERVPATGHHGSRRYTVDLHSVFDSLLCERFGKGVDSRVEREDKSYMGYEYPIEISAMFEGSDMCGFWSFASRDSFYNARY